MRAWQDVVNWALPLYAIPQSMPAAVLDVVQHIAGEADNPQQRTLSVLRFVQDNIRYLGIEVGSSSHVPTPADIVLQRRFGDCKDKTLLMVTLLKALGIDAAPALVNTKRRGGIAELLPTVSAFDHVIVRAVVDGNSYWLDPTRQYQRGMLATIAQANYGAALVIEPGGSALVTLPGPRQTEPHKRVVENVDLRGSDGEPVPYTVTTSYSGYLADNVRARLAVTNRTALEKDELDYFSQYYPQLRRRAAMEVADDERGNVITITNHFDILEMWERGDDTINRATFAPADIIDLARTPQSANRTMPLARLHPFDVTQETTVLLPPDWQLQNSQMHIADSAFAFSASTAFASDQLHISYDYRSLADHVDRPRITEYVKNLQRMGKALGYVLSAGQTRAEEPPRMAHLNWTGIGLLVFASLLLSGAAIAVYRYDPSARPLRPGECARRVGLGGWLVVPALGLIAMPIVAVWHGQDLLGLVYLENWNALVDSSSGTYSPLAAPVLLFIAVGLLGRVIVPMLLLLLFFTRRSSFPLVYSVSLICFFVGDVVTAVGVSYVPAMAEELGSDGYKYLGREALALIIWLSYFRVSKRVKATFTRTLAAKGGSGGGYAPETAAAPATLTVTP
jgi:hypothetical protein